MCDCPDRCDMEFEYDWKFTHTYLNYLVDSPTYFLNSGDTLTLALKNISVSKLSLGSNKGKVDMTKLDENTWSVKVPDDWTEQDTFFVTMESGSCTGLLYQGLLNNQVTKYCDKFKIPDDFIQCTDGTINVERDENLNFVLSSSQSKGDK